MMETVLEIIKYTLPSLIVFLTAFFLVKSYMAQEQKKLKAELQKESKKTTIPIVLGAYERLTLFLERIIPNNLMPRVNQPGMTPAQLHTALIRSIRDEYEHNLSQQLYVSGKAWEMVKHAREEILRIVNVSMTKAGGDGTSDALAKAIIEEWIESNGSTVSAALNQLKAEAKTYFE